MPVETDARDAGKRLHALDERAVERVRLLVRVDPAFGHRQREREHALRAQPEVGPDELDEALQRQPPAAEQAQGERELEHDERATQPFVATAQLAPAAALERRVRVAAGGLPRRRAPEQDPADRAGREREEQHRHVEPHVHLGRQRERRQQREDRVHQPVGERHPERAADEREHQALGDELAHDDTARRAQRRAHGQLAPARGAAGEQQVGHVRARDQQHEADGPQQQPERRLRLAGHEVVAEGLDADRPLRVRRRVRLGEALRHHGHLLVGLVERDARLESPHHEHPAPAAVLLGVESLRQPQPVHVLVGWTLSEHAHDRVRLLVDADRLAHDRGVAAEPLLPEPMRQHHGVVAPGRPFLFDEGASKRERVPVAEHGEEARGRGARLDPLGTAVDREVHVASVPGVQVLEHRGAALPVDEVGLRHALAPAFEVRPHHHQALRVAIRQRREPGRVDHAEHRGRRADAERQRQDGDQSGAGIAAQEPKPEARVTQDLGHALLEAILLPCGAPPKSLDRRGFARSTRPAGSQSRNRAVPAVNVSTALNLEACHENACRLQDFDARLPLSPETITVQTVWLVASKGEYEASERALPVDAAKVFRSGAVSHGAQQLGAPIDHLPH